MRVDAVISGTHIAFSHDAHCPEISPLVCADPDIEMLPHEHHQGVTMLRYQTTVSFGLGNGWQVMGMIPVDAKLLSIEYTTMDGQPYDPPYGDIHHRNETLFGLGDGRLEAQYFTQAASAWVVGGGLGFTLPMGRTEENPYLLAERSEKHQHMQMGSGTVDPVFALFSVWTGPKWGGILKSNGLLPVVQNRYGYKPSPVLTVSGGPSYVLTPKWTTTAEISLSREWQAHWDGEPDRMSGRTVLTAGGALIYRLSPQWSTMVQTHSTLMQWSDAALILQRFKGTVGVSWTPRSHSAAGDHHSAR